MPKTMYLELDLNYFKRNYSFCIEMYYPWKFYLRVVQASKVGYKYMKIFYRLCKTSLNIHEGVINFTKYASK